MHNQYFFVGLELVPLKSDVLTDVDKVQMLAYEEASIESLIGLNQKYKYFLERIFFKHVVRNCGTLTTINFNWRSMILEMKP